MLVYGDHCEVANPHERLGLLGAGIPVIAAMAPGIERHAKLVGALIEAGQLLQGVADQECPADELNVFVYYLAQCVVRSVDSGFAEIGNVPQPPVLDLPARVELRLPEGFAFYAVYPEAYVEAARRLNLKGAVRVIGIRSIGATLGAVVAASLMAPPPITVRPFGDPFARQVELPSEIVESDAHYVVVDEGPGMSGSSFGSVADWLESRGVPLERVAFLPSHGGDLGAQASDAHRRRWRHVQRVAAEFDPEFLVRRFGQLEEISGGGAWQRRKYLARRGDKRLLLKFAGLGAIGERKLEMARALHSTGFTAEPLGLVHGFLVERWREDARPLDADDKPVEAIGRYIGARAALFPADAANGASMGELLTMCRRNFSLALGGELDREWDVNALAARVRRVRTDNKLDRQEWLRLPSGRLLKTDAIDHHQAHDLIGCQDVAWDVAGAAIEFDLDPDEVARLITATGRRIDPDLLDFCLTAYPCFRIGQAVLAGDEASRERYAAQLRASLQLTFAATRQDSLVG